MDTLKKRNHEVDERPIHMEGLEIETELKCERCGEYRVSSKFQKENLSGGKSRRRKYCKVCPSDEPVKHTSRPRHSYTELIAIINSLREDLKVQNDIIEQDGLSIGLLTRRVQSLEGEREGQSQASERGDL